MSMPRFLKPWIAALQRHANAWWYAPVVGLLAALDSFLVVIPTDGLLVGAVLLSPRRWIYTAVVVTLGSTAGAWALAAVLEIHGLPFLLQLNPGLNETWAWVWSVKIMDQWGALALFLVALSPLMQQPAVALAALAGMPLWHVFALVFAGRILKYGFVCWIASHAPAYLERLWGLGSELEEAGIPKASTGGMKVVESTTKSRKA